MNLIIFCDGTWNTPEQEDEGITSPTNVVKLYNALGANDQQGEEQRVYYHPGVGTDGGWVSRMVGGGVGKGLDHNIISAYNWLARNYQPGAKIWLFGFSRGAYTARSLAGMISRCGLLNARRTGMTEAGIWQEINELFTVYRQREDDVPPVTAPDDERFFLVKGGEPCKHSVPVYFIGVWDTVGALGIPDDLALLNLLESAEKYQFHDTGLSPIVRYGRHALAMDERRQSFIPTLWTNVTHNANVKQLWFPGVHSDVGGGYARCGLSDGALAWMMDEAAELGLGFLPLARKQVSANANDFLHDSVTGPFKLLKTRPRSVPRVTDKNADFHSSAIERYNNPPLAQGKYWKTVFLASGQSVSVDIYAAQRWNDTTIWLEENGVYTLTATGEWVDGSINCGPSGTRDGKFHPAEIANLASTLWGKGEALYSRHTDNHQIDFWYTRREESADWFALIGVVANDVLSVQGKNNIPTATQHQKFIIGDSQIVKPVKSGYLYAFANDAWQTYSNNRGSVRLTITRE